MKFVYSDRYRLDIGAHVFPTIKYSRVRDALVERRIAMPGDFMEPETASWEDLALVHTPEYLEKVRNGNLTLNEVALMEIPWSPHIVEGFRFMTGGTILAARLALETPQSDVRPSTDARDALTAVEGRSPVSDLGPRTSDVGRFTIVMHLGGGFHHAHCNHGEGFCMFNDVAVAIRRLKKDASVARVAVIDCDVHDGNGTAAIFTGERSVFTFSMHQLHNYPAMKPPGSLDVALDDGTTDEEYLRELKEALPRLFKSNPQMVFYLAGADPYREDQLGGLQLTLDGLRRRDRLVFEAARKANVPVVVVLAGGYAHRVEDTVAIHVATAEEAIAVMGKKPGEAGSEEFTD